MMASYVPVGKLENDACCGCCCRQQSPSTQSGCLSRRCLVAMLVICLLAITLLIVRGVLSRPQQTLSWHDCSDKRQLYNTTGFAVLTGGLSNKCQTNKPQAVRDNTRLQNSVKQPAVGFSTPCSASAIALLAENVYDENEIPLRRLPRCLIIGVRKGGTRALLEFLNLHPDVHAERREMHFFDNDNRYRRGLDWYRRQMRESHAGQLTLEKTPAYFVEDEVASRVHEMNSSIRLLVTFRDPVERAISDYLQIQEQREAKGKPRLKFERLVTDSETGDIDDAYQAVSRSMYDVHLKRWLRYFSINQFHFLSAENLVANPVEELQRIETFLGLRHRLTKDLFYFNESRGFYCMCVDQRKREANPDRQASVDGKCLSSSKGRIHPTIDPGVLNKLHEFFRPHNERLYRMVGINFGWK